MREVKSRVRDSFDGLSQPLAETVHHLLRAVLSVHGVVRVAQESCVHLTVHASSAQGIKERSAKRVEHLRSIRNLMRPEVAAPPLGPRSCTVGAWGNLRE